METTRLSSKGQIVLPRSIRSARHLKPGVQFSVENTAQGVLLKPLKPFAPTRIEEVCGSASYRGRRLSVRAMDAAIAKEARKHR